MPPGMHCSSTRFFVGVERKICGLDLVYTLFVGSFYIVDLSQSRFGSVVYAYASDWFFSFISHMDLSCIRTLDLHCDSVDSVFRLPIL